MVYFVIYTRMTPYDEVSLIRQGNHAAALSLAGTLIGFSLPITSALLHTPDYYQFLGWAAGAMLPPACSRCRKTRSKRTIRHSAACSPACRSPSGW
jgi:putative membrane protein